MRTYKVFVIVLFTVLIVPWLLVGVFAYAIWVSRLASSFIGYGPGGG